MRGKALLAAVAAAFVAGCVSSGTNVSNDQISHFQKGVTTEQDVMKTLGRAQSTAIGTDGTHSLIYVWNHAQAKAASFIPVVGLFAGGATGEMNIVTFQFDTDGKLKSYATSQTNTDVRTGIAAGGPAATN